MNNFWQKLKKPIVGLAPMDGVTDQAFRWMVCKYGKPDVVYTEFTNVEGLARGAVKMLEAFRYGEAESRVARLVAQIYGVEVESFYKATVMLCAMGFDGVDINMGCPMNKVARKGSGAALIRTPAVAKEIVAACKRGVRDFAEGIGMKDAGVHPEIIAAVEKDWPIDKTKRREVPVSVKTRVGYEKPSAAKWCKTLVSMQPDCICMHGRTLKQLYTGNSDWEEIAKAAKIAKDAGIVFLGNGDVESVEDVASRCERYGVDGVLVGRGALGKPWFFGGKEPTVKCRLKMLVEHSRKFEKFYPEVPFVAMRKHMGWYCKGFDGAKDLRIALMKVESAEEVERIVGAF